MFSTLFMSMIIFNNQIKQTSKCSVWIMTTCVNSDARVSIFTSRKDCLFKSEVMFVWNILKLVPYFSSEILFEEWFRSRWEDWVTANIFRYFKLWSNFNILLRLFFIGFFKLIFIVLTLAIFLLLRRDSIFPWWRLIEELRVMRRLLYRVNYSNTSLFYFFLFLLLLLL